MGICSTAHKEGGLEISQERNAGLTTFHLPHYLHPALHSVHTRYSSTLNDSMHRGMAHVVTRFGTTMNSAGLFSG